MDIWKQSTISGNLAFNQHRNEDAERHYRQACQRAQQLLWVWFDAEEVVAALVVSFQNLAELYFRQSRHHEGLSQYQLLSALLLSYYVKCDSERVGEAVALASKRAGTELLFVMRKLDLKSEYATQVLTQFTDQSWGDGLTARA